MPLDAVAFVWDHCLLDGWPAEFPVFLADVLRLLRNQLLAAADEHALRVALIDAPAKVRTCDLRDAWARRQRLKRSEGAPPSEAYLCTGMDVYMTDEPCVMCAMALLHSRVRRAVYRRRDSEMGGLGSVESVHALSSTNHRFRAWRVVDGGS